MIKFYFLALLTLSSTVSSPVLAEPEFPFYAEQDLVVYEAADPKTSILVFTDVDCGYCQKLHKEIPDLNASGVSVYYAPFPRSGLNTKSHKVFQSVYCSDDRKKALTKAKNNFVLDKADCNVDPVPNIYGNAAEQGIRGTPFIITDDGRNMPGYKPAKQLTKELGVSYVSASDAQRIAFSPLNYQDESIPPTFYTGKKTVSLFQLPSHEQKKVWSLKKRNIRKATIKTVVDGEEWIGFEHKKRTYYGPAADMTLLGVEEDYAVVEVNPVLYVTTEKAGLFLTPDVAMGTLQEISANRSLEVTFEYQSNGVEWLGYQRKGLNYFIEKDKLALQQ